MTVTAAWRGTEIARSDAARYHPSPPPAAAELAGRIAFRYRIDVRLEHGGAGGEHTGLRHGRRRRLAKQ